MCAMTGGTAKLVHTGIPNYGSATMYPVKLYVYYKSSQNRDTNKSTVSTGMYVTVSAGYPVGPWTDYAGSYVGTTALTFDGSISNMTGTKWLAENKTFTVQHDDEGNAKATIKWQWGVRSNWGQCYEESGEFTIDLPNIPRASTIGATDADIGSTSSVVVVKQAAAYTHSIKVQFGKLTKYLKADGTLSDTEVKISATNIAFTVPDTFYAQIPNASSGTCNLICTTYSGSTVIGTAQTAKFKATASKAKCAPVVSGTVIDVNDKTVSLTGDANTLIRYCSTVQCTIKTTPRNSATISTKKIGGVTVQEDTRTIENIETGEVAFSATDSRGYTTATTVRKTVVPYIKLSANVLLERVDPVSGRAVLTIWGDYFNNTFGAVANSIHIKYSLARSGMSYGDYIEVDAVLEGNTYSVEVALADLDYNYAYSAQVVVEDALLLQNKVASVGRGIPLCDWGEVDFRFNYAVRFTEYCFGDTLPTEDLLVGRVFLLQNAGGGFTPRIYDGTKWL